MGKFNNKISAEYNPPRKWILERALTYTNPDIDEDGTYNDVDNCPNDYNPGQYDDDGDGIGNVCDECSNMLGDVNDDLQMVLSFYLSGNRRS